jgi:hypothetical protein
MENKGLLFIPDISGFTRFVNETEIEHSRLIIQELLELLINANEIGLEISEIEGDAILFYKFGEAPTLNELYKQVEKMFCEFHQNLIAYDHRRYCQCKACMSAVDLTLKVVTHYGEFTQYTVKNFSKLIGKDIIVAHQLLKNDIDQHEYWLVTKNLLKDIPPGFARWMQWNSSVKETEGGQVTFYYTQLGALKNEISAHVPPKLDLSKKQKIISVSKEYDTDLITLFHASGDFKYRHRWQEGVKTVEEVNHFLPRIGMRCRCVHEDGQEFIYSSSYSYSLDKIEFSETDEKNKNVRYITLEKIATKKSRLTLDFYADKDIPGEEMFNPSKKKELEENVRRSLDNIIDLVKEIQLPVEA